MDRGLRSEIALKACAAALFFVGLWSVLTPYVVSGDGSPLAVGTATLSGTVQAPKAFQAAQVYARNLDKNILYMAYTASGAYRIVTLLPGRYELTVKKNGFEADIKKINVTDGSAQKADFNLRQAPLKTLRGIHNYAESIDLSFYHSGDIPVFSYDELYPPGRGRDLIEKTCLLCHGPDFLPSHRWSEAQWNVGIDLMSDMTSVSPGRILPGTFSSAERTTVVEYLAANFGPHSVKRAMAVPEMPVDEQSLSKAMYVEYEVPDAYGGYPLHDPHIDNQGNIWLTLRSPGKPSLARLDPRTGNWKDYPINDTLAYPHGLTTDRDGKIWFASNIGLGFLTPENNKVQLYYFGKRDRESHGHTPILDSKQNVWFTVSFTNALGKWDRTTNEISMRQLPTPYSMPYGIAADSHDNIWVAGWFRCKIAKFDPLTEKFTEYTPLSQPCTVRRLSVDSKDFVWYALDSKGKIGKLDPHTGEMVEYSVPVAGSYPYDIWPDPQDNLWISDSGQGGALIKFNQESKSFTYYPSPTMTDMPKLDISRDGSAIWYSVRSGLKPAMGVLYPDISKIKK